MPRTRDPLAAISAIPPDGRRLLPVQAAPLRSGAVVPFLRQVRRQIPGQRLVIGDGSPLHRAATIRECLAAGAARRRHRARRPADAPELNPDEGIGRYRKYLERRNRCCPTRWDRDHAVRLAARRLRRQPQAMRACFTQAGCV